MRKREYFLFVAPKYHPSSLSLSLSLALSPFSCFLKSRLPRTTRDETAAAAAFCIVNTPQKEKVADAVSQCEWQKFVILLPCFNFLPTNR